MNVARSRRLAAALEALEMPKAGCHGVLWRGVVVRRRYRQILGYRGSIKMLSVIETLRLIGSGINKRYWNSIFLQIPEGVHCNGA